MAAPAPVISPETSKAKMAVTKGLRVGKHYPIMKGVTYVGRKGPQPVDVDLSEQESPGVAVAVNRFALIWFDKNGLAIADTGEKSPCYDAPGFRPPNASRSRTRTRFSSARRSCR